MLVVPFTEYEAKELLNAKKFIHKVRQSNYRQARRNPTINEIQIRYDIRRADHPKNDIKLQFYARLERAVFSAEPPRLPGISLSWHRLRLRSISHALRHEDIQNGLPAGYVKGWYEHRWTDTDRDKHIVGVNEDLKHVNSDLLSMIKFCFRRWKIEAPEQLDLGE
jgi:hypothetical protein